MNEVGHNSSSKVKIECPEEEDTERRVSAIILLVSVAFSLLDIDNWYFHGRPSNVVLSMA